jgi:hypothetical protein
MESSSRILKGKAIVQAVKGLNVIKVEQVDEPNWLERLWDISYAKKILKAQLKAQKHCDSLNLKDRVARQIIKDRYP